MLADERLESILSRLERDGRVQVSPLSAAFGVSEETIRRDLEKLEAEGLARRFYGGASFTGGRELPSSVRKKSNVSAKRRIAAAVAALIGDGDSVMLDDSSTATFVAQALLDKQNLTVITNSVEIVLLLTKQQGWTVLLAGGALKLPSLSLAGAKAEQFLAEYHVDWSVVSCAGLDLSCGVSDVGEDTARIKQAMLRAGERTVLAADGRKFGRRAFAAVCPLSALDTVVTDLEETDELCQALRAQSVRVICS